MQQHTSVKRCAQVAAIHQHADKTHLDEQRQGPAVHDLALVVVILERQRAQRPSPCALHLEVPAAQQPHQRRDAAVLAHLFVLLCDAAAAQQSTSMSDEA